MPANADPNDRVGYIAILWAVLETNFDKKYVKTLKEM
jgi:hypothetical protein